MILILVCGKAYHFEITFQKSFVIQHLVYVTFVWFEYEVKKYFCNLFFCRKFFKLIAGKKSHKVPLHDMLLNIEAEECAVL